MYDLLIRKPKYTCCRGVNLEAAKRKVCLHSLTDFEVGGFQGRAGEQPWKDHVYGDRKAMTNIALRYLDILNLGGVSGIALRAP